MYNPGLPNKSQEFLFLQKREQWVRSVEEDVWGEITTWMDLTLAGWRAFDQSAHFLLKENLQRHSTDLTMVKVSPIGSHLSQCMQMPT